MSDMGGRKGENPLLDVVICPDAHVAPVYTHTHSYTYAHTCMHTLTHMYTHIWCDGSKQREEM